MTATGVLQAVLYGWTLADMETYRDAALRLREGQPLYSDASVNFAYRYAPWFAVAWVPLSYVPCWAIAVLWSLTLLAASAYSVRGLLTLEHESVVLLGLVVPTLWIASSMGNVQPLIVAALIAGLRTRWAWAAIAATASLKVAPLAFCAVLIAERRWRQTLAAAGATVLLWAPILLFEVDPLTFREDSSPVAEWSWLPFALGASVYALWLAFRRSPWTELTSAATAVLAMPRFFVYDLTLLLVASRHHRGHVRGGLKGDRVSHALPAGQGDA